MTASNSKQIFVPDFRQSEQDIMGFSPMHRPKVLVKRSYTPIVFLLFVLLYLLFCHLERFCIFCVLHTIFLLFTGLLFCQFDN